MSTAGFVHAKAVELGKHVLRMTSTAGSGHPSSALALCHIVVELMYRRMRYDPGNPWNPNSDRLVLSIGHAVPIVYAAYADLQGAVGVDRASPTRLGIEDLADLRELGSTLDGHPNPAEGFPFFDAATGSLGQGLSVGAGLALAARLHGIDKRIYVILGDGESREGQVWEAADFIVDHRLNEVCALFSCNGQGQAAPVSSQQSPDAIAAKMAAFGWNVVEVDGHNPDELSSALDGAEVSDRPTAVIARTIKGWGVESIQAKNFHGKPIPPDNLDAALAELDETGKQLGAQAASSLKPPAPAPPSEPSSAPRARTRLPSFEDACRRVGLSSALEDKKLATRVAFGVALVALGDLDDRVVSLDGDVSNSTFSEMFARKHPDRFFECKIAEQNMVSVGAGLAAGGMIPFAGSFGKFIARAADQIDLAAITRANLKIVGSHCGVSLGADGPSQMSVSDVAYFRSLTRVEDGRGGIACHIFQPCDAISAYRCVELMADIEGLCYLRTFRPAADFVYSMDERFEPRGFKQLRSGQHLSLASCGYMLHTVLEAAAKLAERGIACNVFDCYTLPLDADPILEIARNQGTAILTIEDNYSGGLHAELAEAAAQRGDVRVVGLTARRIPKSAKTAAEVFSHVGVGLEYILQKAGELVE